LSKKAKKSKFIFSGLPVLFEILLKKSFANNFLFFSQKVNQIVKVPFKATVILLLFQ